MVNLVRERADEEGIGVNFEALVSSHDKFGRIQTLQSLVSSGKLQFSRKGRLLLDQLKYFPKDRHDDGPDALAMAVKEASTSKRVTFMPLTGGDDFIDEEYRKEMDSVIDKYGRNVYHPDYGRPSIFEDAYED